MRGINNLCRNRYISLGMLLLLFVFLIAYTFYVNWLTFYITIDISTIQSILAYKTSSVQYEMSPEDQKKYNKKVKAYLKERRITLLKYCGDVCDTASKEYQGMYKN